MLNMKESRAMDEVAINAKILVLTKGLFDLRLQKLTTGNDKTHIVKQNRRDIARLRTILNEKRRK